MYKCTKCGKEFYSDVPPDNCPYCHVRFSGIKCEGCGYVGSKSDFVNNRCPKCSRIVHIPSEKDNKIDPAIQAIAVVAIIFVLSIITRGC